MSTTAGVGLSTDADPLKAAREAARTALAGVGEARADWCLVFATAPYRPHYAAMLAAIQDTLGTSILSGCSGWGVIAGDREIESGPGVAVLAVRSDRIEACGLIVPLDGDETRSAAGEIGALQRSRPGLSFLLPDPFASPLDSLLHDLKEVAPGARTIGAAASGDPHLGHTFQYYGRNVATRSVALLHLSGSVNATIGITQGCQPLGNPCRVTRCQGNIVHSLDGRPALDALRSRMPAGVRNALERLGGHLFVGIPPQPGQERFEHGEYLVRGLLGIDPKEGSIAVGTTVEEGQPILLLLRDPQAAREDLKGMLDRLGTATGDNPPRFGLYFNCAARGSSLYGHPGIDTAFIASRFPGLPIIGFFGNAEIAPLHGSNLIFTHTGVLALITEA